MKKMNFKSESGFTLMELMVVIGVLAILIAILLPQFTGYTAQAQAVSAASQIKNALTSGYSYYVSVTSRNTPTTGAAGTTTPAFDGEVAFERMSKAVKNNGKINDIAAGTANSSVGADPTQVKYEVQKGDLTFTAYLDLTTGNLYEAASKPANGLGLMDCTGVVDVCDDLGSEGALRIQ